MKIKVKTKECLIPLYTIYIFSCDKNNKSDILQWYYIGIKGNIVSYIILNDPEIYEDFLDRELALIEDGTYLCTGEKIEK